VALADGGVSGFVDEETEVFERADVLVELIRLFGGEVLEVVGELEGFLFEEKKGGGGEFGGTGGGVLVDFSGGVEERRIDAEGGRGRRRCGGGDF